MEYETVRLERAGAVATLTLNRPEKLNALNAQVHADLQAVCAALRTDFETRVVILTGAGRAFSAGADIKAQRTEPLPNPLERRYEYAMGSRTCKALEELDQITIAGVNGLAIGGGLVLAATCDIRVAAESAWFSIPEVELGIPLTWNAIPRLVRQVGPARALELIGSCDRFSARQALDWGFVNHVVGDQGLNDFVGALAARFVAKPIIPLAYTKLTIRALNRASELGDVTYADPDMRILPRLYPEDGGSRVPE
jgi:enoyl-CoA hydratase/carnithine racemase